MKICFSTLGCAERDLDGVLALAKKYNMDESEIEHSIIEKKEYNRYAPKIYNAKTAQDLDKVRELVLSERSFYYSTKELLCQLIAQRKASLK